MRVGSKVASLVTAVAAVSLMSAAHAADLQWDANGPADPLAADGNGNWNLESGNAVWNAGTTNVAWSNGNNAIFGSSTVGAPAGQIVPYNVDTGAAIQTADLIVGLASNGNVGAVYNFSDFNGGSLTLGGNFVKNAAAGQVNFLLFNGLSLTAGDHTFTIRDTPGDVPEVTVNSFVTGSGNIIVDNSAAYDSWGTIVFNSSNDYTGTTAINKGRLIITTSDGLGATGAGTTISNQGTLAIGGAGANAANNLTIAEPITITRNTYTGTNFTQYPAAIIASNDGSVNTHTFTGPIVIDSTDARVQANTNRIVFPNAFVAGPTSGANSMFTADGDFAGFITLSGDNTSFAAAGGTIGIRGGVEVDVSSEANLGGPTSKLNLVGGTIHATGSLGAAGSPFMTNFGAHNLGTTPIGTGLDLDAGQVFTVNNITGNAIGTRGTGTINFTGTNTFTGVPFFDGGAANINGNTTVGAFRLRNATMTVASGVTLTTTNSYTSVAVDTGEHATLNLENGAHLVAANQDFNVADNRGTTATMNIKTNATAQIGGSFEIAKNPAAVGTVNMDGTSLSIGGEFWVGNEATAVGTYNQSAGAVTVGNWMAVGRHGALGTVNLSGGSITKNGGGNSYVGESTGAVTSVMNVTGTGKFIVNNGEFWLGNAGGSKGVLNIQDQGDVEVLNNWLAVGRNGGSVGTLNLISGTLVKAGGGNLTIGSGNATGTVTQTGGTLTSNSTYIGEGGGGLMDLRAGTASLGPVSVGRNGTAGGELRISGTSAVTTGAILMAGVNGTGDTTPGTINLSGGSLNAASIAHGIGTGVATVNFTGGTLSVGTYSVAGGLNNSGTGTFAPGGLGTVGSSAITTGYTQAATARLAADVNTSVVDNVAVTGNVNLAGALALTLIPGATPAYNAPQQLMSFTGTRTGIFGTVEGVNIASNKALAVTYDPNAVNVQVALPGDATLDGTVAFADLVKLAQNYNGAGKSWVDGDFNGDGNVAFADLVKLAQFYNQSTAGQPAGLAANAVFSSAFQADWALAQSMVPEPTSLTLLGLGGLAAVRRRRA